MPKAINIAPAGEIRARQFNGLNDPILEENPLLLYTVAYCELIEALADSLFPPNTMTDGSGERLTVLASSARVDRYIHCRSAWDHSFGRTVQLALRDLASAAVLAFDKSFAGLDCSLRTRLLRELQAGSLTPDVWQSPRSQPDAFNTLHDAIAAGVFADPGYGGNVEGVGWKYSHFVL